MSPRDWNSILELEKMREASRRSRRTTRNEVIGGVILALVLAAFVFAWLWQSSGRGPLF